MAVWMPLGHHAGRIVPVVAKEDGVDFILRLRDDVPRSVENAKRSLPCLQYQLMLLRQAFVCLSCLIALHSECRALPAAWEVVCKPSACESLSWLPASPQPSSARP